MNETDEVSWLESIVQCKDGYEAEAVHRFTARLVLLAKAQLPQRMQQRVDPEDIVQSVFKSFFARHSGGQFQFEETPDVWRLLAAITYRKAKRTIRFHHQQQRDISQEAGSDEAVPKARDVAPSASSLVMMMELLDGILEKIPETHREIVRLRLEEHSIDDIAAIVQVSTRTVDRALALVRKVATEMIFES